MFADQENEDPQFTRAMWRMSIAMNASTPGYAQWVQQTKRSLEWLQAPTVKRSSAPFDELPPGSIQIMAEPMKHSLRYVPHTSDY